MKLLVVRSTRGKTFSPRELAALQLFLLREPDVEISYHYLDEVEVDESRFRTVGLGDMIFDEADGLSAACDVVVSDPPPGRVMDHGAVPTSNCPCPRCR